MFVYRFCYPLLLFVLQDISGLSAEFMYKFTKEMAILPAIEMSIITDIQTNLRLNIELFLSF